MLQSRRAGNLFESRLQGAQGVIHMMPGRTGDTGQARGAGRQDRATFRDQPLGEFLDEGIGQNPLVPRSQRSRGFCIGL